MQCNYTSFILIINFHGLFRNARRCRKTGASRILVPDSTTRPLSKCQINSSIILHEQTSRKQTATKLNSRGFSHNPENCLTF